MTEHSDEIASLRAEIKRMRSIADDQHARYMAEAAENTLLREALERIAIIGDTVEVGPTCHWHVEAAAIAKAALIGSTEGAPDGR